MPKNITLPQIRATAQRVKNELDALEADTVDAIEAVYSAKADAPVWATKTVATNNWTTNSDTTTNSQGYVYKANIPFTNITANDSAELIVLPADISVALAAELCPTCDVIANYITVYAKNTPTASISFQVRPIIDTSV